MQIRDIANKLNASVLTPELDMSREVIHAFSSDLMSDVLASCQEGDLLITGLINAQAVRTAEVVDIGAIVFVHGSGGWRKSHEHWLKTFNKMGIATFRLSSFEPRGISRTVGSL